MMVILKSAINIRTLLCNVRQHWPILTILNNRQIHQSSISSTKYKIAIIGSGPAGFYTTQQLIKNPNVSVDIYEKFPVPFGLVRFGVAPDHQEVKNVINSFTKVAQNERTRFIGNVNIGTDVTLSELRSAYHAVVLCYGSSQDTKLNIPGEEFGNVLSARRFVGWYNGIPQDKDLDFTLDTDTAVIIGQGNVAIDCARILLLSVDSLKKTDITNHAYLRLLNSNIRKVIIVGRRGPMQAAYKIKEFRELTKMENCNVMLNLVYESQSMFSDELMETYSKPRRRFAELYRKIYDRQTICNDTGSSKECELKFFHTPIEIISNGDNMNPKVSSVRFKRNILENNSDENAKVIKTLDQPIEEIKCGIVIRSIGYRSTPIDDSLPFDAKRGVILNKDGRVVNNRGLYCSGWAAFGATGVILNTMKASFEVGKNILSDIDNCLLDEGDCRGYDAIGPVLMERNSEIVDFIDWQRIDQYERELGQKEGKPREKLVNFDDIMKIKSKPDN